MRALILGGLALALGTGATIVTSRWLDRAAEARSEPAAVSLLVPVVAAARDLQPGDRITRADLVSLPWPQQALPVGAIPERQADWPTLDGAIVVAAVPAGAPLLHGHVVPAAETGVLSALLAPGMRAVSIALTPAAALSGWVGPGDLVDILVTQALASGPAAGRHVTHTLATGVKVLAIDQRARPLGPRAGEAGPEAAEPPSTVTLEVTPRMAEALTGAQQAGALSLALRARANDPGAHRLEPQLVQPAFERTDEPPSRAWRPTAPPRAAAPRAAVEAPPPAPAGPVEVVRGSSLRSGASS